MNHLFVSTSTFLQSTCHGVEEGQNPGQAVCIDLNGVSCMTVRQHEHEQLSHVNERSHRVEMRAGAACKPPPKQRLKNERLNACLLPAEVELNGWLVG